MSLVWHMSRSYRKTRAMIKPKFCPL